MLGHPGPPGLPPEPDDGGHRDGEDQAVEEHDGEPGQVVEVHDGVGVRDEAPGEKQVRGVGRRR